MKNRNLRLSITVLITLITSLILFSDIFGQSKITDNEWPKVLSSDGIKITLYHPQIDSLIENNLNGRMAISVQQENNSPSFGALWFSTNILTNKLDRTIEASNIDISKLVLPDFKNELDVAKLEDKIIKEFINKRFILSLDKVLASLEYVKELDTLQSGFNNLPPRIIFKNSRTILVSINGNPVFKKDEKSRLDYVANTPFTIVLKDSTFFLYGNGSWYRSVDLLEGNWNRTDSVPNDINDYWKSVSSEHLNVTTQSILDTVHTEIIVTTVPSELILFKGELNYEPITGTELLLISNTESDIVFDIQSQYHYLLLNGRWFKSKMLFKDDWTFVEPHDLPLQFHNIPSTSEYNAIRIAVPGTPESIEAVYEQYVPQTATIDRKSAEVNVSYIGEPKFEQIENTKLYLAVNSSLTVLRNENKYYCVDKGVWFQANSPHGPWRVSDDRPKEVTKIPPTSPAYNVKFVYIYSSTPNVVYVGYTPGYCHSYIYNGVVVYGTGINYAALYPNNYYPMPITYGFGVHYNTYSGWGFYAGYSYSWINPYSPYWGYYGYPVGYRHGVVVHHHNYYGNATKNGSGRNTSKNIYSRRDNGVIQSNNSLKGKDQFNFKSEDRSRNNDVYTDKKGNVYNRQANGQWKNLNSTRGLDQKRKIEMNQEFLKRQRGQQRQGNFKSSFSRRR